MFTLDLSGFGAAAAAQQAQQMQKAREAADAGIDLQAAEELKARNEATASRINQTAMGGAGNVTGRIGGGRYSRMQTWRPGGTGGLAKANATALTEARKKEAYADLALQQQQQPQPFTIGVTSRRQAFSL